MQLQEIVSRDNDKDVLSGDLVFAGTRVPVKNLVDYLAAGDTLDEFLDAFPGVSREQALAYLHITLVATDALREVLRVANQAEGALANAAKLEEISEKTWLRAAAANPAFDFLDDPREDIYSPRTDGLWAMGSFER